MDESAWNAINRMNNMKSSFTPKWGKNFGRKKKSTNSVKNMTKLSFSSTIFTLRIDDEGEIGSEVGHYS